MAAAASLFVVAHLIAAEMDRTGTQAATAPQTVAEVTKEDTPAKIRPVVAIVEAQPTPEEVEESAEEDYYREDIPLPRVEQEYLHNAAEEFGVDYYIMVALIDRETRFQNIYGDGGNAYGYCQIWPKWWSGLMAEIGAEDLNDPQDNFRTAAAILAQNMERFGDIESALTAYNTGASGKSEYATNVLTLAEKWRDG